MLETLLLKRIFNADNQNLRISGCGAGVTAHILGQHIHLAKKNAIFVTASHADLKLYENILQFFDPTLHIVAFPPWDCLRARRVIPRLAIKV